MHYHRKLVISGNYFELYKYEKSLKRDFTRKKKSLLKHEQLEIDDFIDEESESEKEIKQLIKRKDSIIRTRTQIRRIVNSNPDFSKFYTLTFKDNITDIKIANKHFNKFIMRMNYNYGNFKYLSIIEFQHRGAVHYHFLCNLPYIDSKEIKKRWGHGFIKINRIKNVSNLGAYVCKYLQKDMTDKRLFNKKKYFCSKDIERPIELFNDRIIASLIEQYDFKNMKPDHESSFENEYTGKVEYKQFKLEA